MPDGARQRPVPACSWKNGGLHLGEGKPPHSIIIMALPKGGHGMGQQLAIQRLGIFQGHGLVIAGMARLANGLLEPESGLDEIKELVLAEARTITGSAMGAVQLRVDIPRIIELYQFGRVKLDEMIGGYYSFDRIQEAIDDMAKGNVVRNVVMFDR